jgi:hypothetical protein
MVMLASNHEGGPMDRRGIHDGMTVHGADGKKLGTVVQCADDMFVIEKGFFFPKDFVARYEQVAEVREDEVHLASESAGIEARRRAEEPVGEGERPARDIGEPEREK